MSLTKGFDRTLHRSALLYLPFNEAVGVNGATLKDIAQPHHLWSMGATGHDPAFVQLPSGLWVLQFSGAVVDYLTCTAANSQDFRFLTSTSFFTVVMWAKWTTFAANYTFIGRWSANKGWMFCLSPGVGYLWGLVNSSQSNIAAGSITDRVNIWTLVSMSRVAASTIRYYVNGVDMTALANGGTPTDSNTIMRIGTSADDSQPYDGYMGIPRIWNRALSPREHVEIFNRERHLFGV